MSKSIILIVDANSRIRRFLERELCAEGFLVEHAGTYDEVISRLGGFPTPDLVVLDPDLPFIGGKPAMERIMNRQPRIPVIIYSPYVEYAEDPVFGRADAFVEKIAYPALLIQTVRMLVNRKRLA